LIFFIVTFHPHREEKNIFALSMSDETKAREVETEKEMTSKNISIA
jgi:hypothetical protein